MLRKGILIFLFILYQLFLNDSLSACINSLNNKVYCLHI